MMKEDFIYLICVIVLLQFTLSLVIAYSHFDLKTTNKILEAKIEMLEMRNEVTIESFGERH